MKTINLTAAKKHLAVGALIVVLTAFTTSSTIYSQSETEPSATDPLTIASSLSSTGNFFLKIGDIEGESTDEKHKGEIEVLSYKLGGELPTIIGNTSNQNSGKTTTNDIHFVIKVDKASPKLFLASASGQHIPEVILTVRKAGGGQQDYFIITLKDVIISSYQVSGESGDEPLSEITLNYNQIEQTYVPQKADGSLDTPIKAGWDFKTNSQISLKP